MAVSDGKSGLVVSAHSADFVWRAGGAVALYAKRGWHVRVICLSYGERGESAKLWRQDGMTLEKVKQVRAEEARRAADVLGAEIVFYDIGDYPMRISDEVIDRLAGEFRELRPEWMLTHSLEDPYNFDHPLTARAAQEARIVAQAHGHNYPEKPIGVPGIFLFEPHQTEQCNWKPHLILDISEVWELKRRAFECMAAQEPLWEYYTRVALQRGVQGKRNSGRDITYGEAYMRILPVVGGDFV